MFSNPRFDFPPGENFEPWFGEHHRDFAIESGRLSEFMDGAEPTCDVAVLYPLRTVWSEGQTAPHAAENGRWLELLAEHGYGYHLVDERDLETAVVRDGRLWFGSRGYRAIVLAGVRTLRSKATVDRLQAASAAGVVVVSSGETVAAYQDGPQTAETDWAQLREVHRLPNPPSARDLRSVIGDPGRDGMAIHIADGARVRSWSGRFGETVRGVVFNDSEEVVTISTEFPVGPVSRIDVSDAHRVTLSAGPNAVLALESHEIALLVAGDGQDASDAPATDPARWGEPVPLDGPWVLRIPQGQHGYGGTVRPVDPAIGWEQQGLEDFSGVADYECSLPLASLRSVRISVSRIAGSATLWVNDIQVGRRGWRPFRWDVPSDVVREGANHIRIRVASSAANRYYAGTAFRSHPEPAGLLARPVVQISEG
jgi:hypothetical protein